MREMSPLGAFFRYKIIFVFLAEGQYLICNIYKYVQKISYFYELFDEDHLPFLSKEKNLIYLGQKKYHLSRYYKKDHIQHLKKTSYFQEPFWERSSFLLRLKNKIIFSGKRHIIFADNTRKIIYQFDFFGKNNFAEHLEK